MPCVREEQPILIRPRRESLSRAGEVIAIGGLPWALLVVIGPVALFSAMGIAVPGIPAGVRLFIAGVALAPAAIALLAGLFGPVPGLTWLFEPAPWLLEHTGCGMLTFKDDEVRRGLAKKTGQDVDLTFHAFGDLEANLRAQIDRIRAHPWIKDVPVHGLIYEVETGRLREVA